MKVIALLFALAVVCNSADVMLGFVRFHATGATPTTNGYLRLVKTAGAFTASGTLSGFTLNTMYWFYAHTYGDMTSSDASAHGGCLVSAELFSATADGAGMITLSSQAIAGAVDLTGASSLLGRGISIRSSQSCSGAAVAQGVVGYDTAGAGDSNVANVAATPTPVSVYARIFPNGNPTQAFANLAGDVFLTPLPSGSGRVAVNGQPATVLVYTRVTGISGDHGIHAHLSCDTSFFNNLTSTQLHFNPAGNVHGYPQQTIRHVGDMGNFTADAQNVGVQSFHLDMQTIGGTNNIVGRCIIIHATFDNGADPVGNAGGRWGYGVLGLSNRKAPNNDLGAASTTVGGSAVAFILAAAMAVRALL